MNQLTRLRDVLVGAAVQAGEATELTLAAVQFSAVHIVVTTTASTRQRLADLAGRGAAEQARARQRAARALDTAVTALATSAIVDRMVDAQLERVLRPLVQGILDDVLAMLEQEPDRIQALVRGQRDTMVDELIGRIRSGASAGDAAVDRITARVLHRDSL
ncbi:arsenate reductase-like glutaredoxin family protein [Actinoplanes tereljensis]|uniref:Uncharacterized protein n=1 Tax=Paractinoplanes tereljensis TaxID=571912 RepID=A0A919TU38_9ACTN|nr:hypothetical protein [Actinoplanes tereljensis]GIF21919.1 hypothetical protein Ate02nite_46490 [Actinoplanes tereljensis]